MLTLHFTAQVQICIEVKLLYRHWILTLIQSLTNIISLFYSSSTSNCQDISYIAQKNLFLNSQKNKHEKSIIYISINSPLPIRLDSVCSNLGEQQGRRKCTKMYNRLILFHNLFLFLLCFVSQITFSQTWMTFDCNTSIGFWNLWPAIGKSNQLINIRAKCTFPMFSKRIEL